MIKKYYCYGTIIKIIDGDTIITESNLGRNIILKKDRLRLAGINAPRKGTPDYESSIAYISQLLVVGSTYRIQTLKTEKYGRFLAIIYLEDGTTVNQKMLDSGNAVKYL